MSSGRKWKWASIIAGACSCSASNNFTFPSHSHGRPQTRSQTLFTGNPAAAARPENKLANVPGCPLHPEPLRSHVWADRRGAEEPSYGSVSFLKATTNPKQVIIHCKTAALDGTDVNLTMLILWIYYVIYHLISLLYIFFLYPRVAFCNSRLIGFDQRPN